MNRSLSGVLLCAVLSWAPTLVFADQFQTALGANSSGVVIERRQGTSGTVNVPVDETNPLPVTVTGGGGGSSGSIGAAGANGTTAQSVQGITGGVPVPVTGGGPPTGTAGTPNAAVVSVQGVSGGTPQPVTQGGTTGIDYSANKPAIPVIGAAFAASGPYASYVLITTVPALSTRNEIEVQNVSGAQIAVLLDDGTAASSAAPVNASLFSLGGGSASGAQGGAWSSTAFKGRVQVYALSSTAFVEVNGR
jgi:hypothetical protein